MARRVEYLQEEVLVLKEALASATGKSRIAFTSEQRRRLAVKGEVLTPEERESCCQLVRPETILRWFRQLAASKYDDSGQRKSLGSRRKAADVRKLVVRIAGENIGWGEDRIAEELALQLGVHHAPRTIRRYMVARGGPRGDQTWRTFVRNHGSAFFACDFLTQDTVLFAVAYVFFVLEIASRRIVLINVTTGPSLDWVKQQTRAATAWSAAPRFWLHDNDGIFGQYRERERRGRNGRRRRCHLDVWLADVMGIEGIPIPYGAPNASPFAERFVRILRQEALDHFLFLSERHILRVCREFVRYYNGARPSQATHAIPDPYPELRVPPAARGRVVALPVLGGIAHDYRRAA
jgi:hypothetical protein